MSDKRAYKKRKASRAILTAHLSIRTNFKVITERIFEKLSIGLLSYPNSLLRHYAYRIVHVKISSWLPTSSSVV